MSDEHAAIAAGEAHANAENAKEVAEEAKEHAEAAHENSEAAINIALDNADQAAEHRNEDEDRWTSMNTRMDEHHGVLQSLTEGLTTLTKAVADLTAERETAGISVSRSPKEEKSEGEEKPAAEREKKEPPAAKRHVWI